MKGGPLALVAYNIGFLPLIKKMKAAYLEVTEPWYTDNSGALGKFNNVELYFNSLKLNGPAWGYYPYSTKVILIVNLDNVEAGKLFGSSRGFKVCMGAHYLGGCIRDEESKRKWLKDWKEKWERNIHAVTQTVGKYHQ